jgi:hypothetical protein
VKTAISFGQNLLVLRDIVALCHRRGVESKPDEAGVTEAAGQNSQI